MGKIKIKKLKSKSTMIINVRDVRELIDPFFMYGTAWKEDQTEELTLMALRCGFRAIDTANQRKHYFEEGVGSGITTFLETEGYQRKDLFIQTKFTYKEGQDHRLPYDPNADFSRQVKQSFQSSLDNLNTDYLDSYILHGPSTRRGLNDRDFEVWGAMEALQREGLTKYIGVSNMNAHQLLLLLGDAEIQPSFVQNRCFAHYGWDRDVRNICKDHEIIYQGFSLLTANRKYLSHNKIKKMAEKYNLSIPGITFCFAKQIGMLPLTGTSQKNHMKQDLSAIENKITEEEINLIENIAT